MSKIITTNKFIERSTIIHGNKYDYSKAIYKKAHSKLIIICPKHGEFLITPNNHIRKKGCPYCGRLIVENAKRLPRDEFIKKAGIVHNGVYNYSKIDYKSTHLPIIISCKEHGDFNQLPSNHLRGKGCPKCKANKLSYKFRSNTEEFIKKAKVIHGDKYSYNKVKYKNDKTKVIIICKQHGNFYIDPRSHLHKKVGCPICSSSKGELIISKILNKYDIKYVKEFKLPEIVSLLRYDFYLPEYRILIEFHGIQHYKYVPFLHQYDEDNFDKQKERDIFKKDHAQRFKYNLLEFNYKQLDTLSEKDFEELLICLIRSKRC